MERLDANIQQSYTSQLAKLYKNLKTAGKLNFAQKVVVYINEQGNLAFFTDKKEAKINKYKKLDHKILYKNLNIEKSIIEQKIVRTAAKALLFLPWKKPFDLETVARDFPDLKAAISPQRSQEIASMLPHVNAIRRSEEGGNGVIFFDTKNDESITIPIKFIIKFVQEPRAVLCADRLLQAMGFVTPKSCFVQEASPLKKQLIATTLDHIENISVDNQSQIKQQTANMRCILIMNNLKTAISLRQLPADELIELFSAPKTCIQLGKMIFLDFLMNNYDRLNTNCCNLGNIMFDHKGILHLIDHEMKISKDVVAAIKDNLTLLIKGKMTDEILRNLEGALKADRKKMGPVALSEELKQEMKIRLDEGIHVAALQIGQILESPSAFNQIFQPYLEESEKIDSKAFLDVVKFVTKSLK